MTLFWAPAAVVPKCGCRHLRPTWPTTWPSSQRSNDISPHLIVTLAETVYWQVVFEHCQVKRNGGSLSTLKIELCESTFTPLHLHQCCCPGGNTQSLPESQVFWFEERMVGSHSVGWSPSDLSKFECPRRNRSRIFEVHCCSKKPAKWSKWRETRRPPTKQSKANPSPNQQLRVCRTSTAISFVGLEQTKPNLQQPHQNNGTTDSYQPRIHCGQSCPKAKPQMVFITITWRWHPFFAQWSEKEEKKQREKTKRMEKHKCRKKKWIHQGSLPNLSPRTKENSLPCSLSLTRMLITALKLGVKMPTPVPPRITAPTLVVQ